MSHFSCKNNSHLLPTGSSSIGATKDQILVSNGRVCLSSNISRQKFLCQNGAFDMARPSLTKSFSSLTLYFNPRAFLSLSALNKEELAWLNSLFGFFFKKRQKQQRLYIIKRFAKLTLLRAVLSLSGNFSSCLSLTRFF